MNNPDILGAIQAIYKDAVASVDCEDVNKITWNDGNPTNITKEQILAKKAELQIKYDALQYSRDRGQTANKGGYPALKDQLDMQYHDLIDGTTTWKDALKAIKDAHPKP